MPPRASAPSSTSASRTGKGGSAEPSADCLPDLRENRRPSFRSGSCPLHAVRTARQGCSRRRKFYNSSESSPRCASGPCEDLRWRSQFNRPLRRWFRARPALSSTRTWRRSRAAAGLPYGRRTRTAPRRSIRASMGRTALLSPIRSSSRTFWRTIETHGLGLLFPFCRIQRLRWEIAGKCAINGFTSSQDEGFGVVSKCEPDSEANRRRRAGAGGDTLTAPSGSPAGRGRGPFCATCCG